MLGRLRFYWLRYRIRRLIRQTEVKCERKRATPYTRTKSWYDV